MTLATRQIHLDFHTGNLPFLVGKNFSPQLFQDTLKRSFVNSITLTARDHNGWVYYQSKNYPHHPQLGQRDFLREEVDAAHKIGVQAPLYLTAGWDATSARLHPEWLERKEDGSMYGFEDHGQLEPGWKTLCFNTSYEDYLIGQSVDLLNHFDGKVDGLFYDILWQDPCYCNTCIDLMIRSGFDPNNLEDQKTFAKETEIRFKHHIVSEVHKVYPQCPIVFNEGNITPLVRSNLRDYDHLEIESLPGGAWGYQHFPITVRYAKNLGKEFLGMTGRFHQGWGDFGSYRSLPALEYESFLALIHGAKCSIGDQMYPDGTLSKRAYDEIGQVYQQISKYEGLENNVYPVTNIGVLHTYVLQDGDEQVDPALAGAVNILNELHLQFDIIDDHSDWSRYKIIVFADKIRLNDQLQKLLSAYLEQGGKLLATYQSGLRIDSDEFVSQMNLINDGESQFYPTYYKFCPGYHFDTETEYVLHARGIDIIPSDNYKVLADQWEPLYQRNFEHYYGHFQAPIGKKDKNHPIAIFSNNIVYISHPLFQMYKQQGSLAYKALIESAINLMIGNDKFIEYENLPTTADVVLNYQPSQNRLVLGMLNYIPRRSSTNIDVVQDVTPIYDIKLKINWKNILQKLGLTKKIKSIVLATTNEKISFTDEHSNIRITVPCINGYEFVVINY